MMCTSFYDRNEENRSADERTNRAHSSTPGDQKKEKKIGPKKKRKTKRKITNQPCVRNCSQLQN